MRVLNKAIFVEANPKNFNSHGIRQPSSIKYIVAHYTGNINDTARNNAIYFRDNVVNASAHYFCWEDTIYQSVKDIYPAYAVGLGSRKTPWIPNPPMYKTITNSNSISVEICGSKNSRKGSDQTLETAAMLIADLLDKYGLTPSCLYRHYDVTGKSCPAWAVDDLEWTIFKTAVCNHFYKEGESEDVFTYEDFLKYQQRYESEKSTLPATWEEEAMAYAESRGLIKDGRPKCNITRGELAEVLRRINA